MIEVRHDIRESHVGRIAQPDREGPIEVDVGALVRRLILFERCVLESILLKEIPALVAVFGVEGLLDLLNDGALSIACDALTIGEMGRLDSKATDLRGGPLPIGSYRLAPVSIADRDQYVEAALTEVDHARISGPEATRLKVELRDRLLSYPRSLASSAVDTTHAELVAAPNAVAAAIRQAAKREIGRDPGAIQVRAEPLPFEGDYRVWTSVRPQTGIDAALEDNIVRRGLLAATGLNQRVHCMEYFQALTSFDNSDATLFAGKLEFIARALDPEAQESRFERVRSVSGLPDLRHLAPGIDVGRLLELRNRPELREFRAWLRRIDTETDGEIAARFDDVRDLTAEALQTPLGRGVRFLAATAVGLTGFLPGALASAADSFLLDRLLGRPGPVAVISRLYESIFLQEDRGA